MVKGFVEQSHGNVRLKTRKGYTEFTLRFPIYKSAVVEKQKEETVQAVKNNKPILFVDDNPQLLLSMERIFQHMNYQGHFLDNAQEAIDLVKSDKNISTAFLDLSMPDMNGIDLGKKLMRLNRSLNCFLLTGHASDELIGEAERAGFMAVLFKPIQVTDLIKISNETVQSKFIVMS